MESQARLYAGKLGFAVEADESVWAQFPPREFDVLALYEAVKALSDHELEGLEVLMAALSFGQAVCESLDASDSLFNRVARDLSVDMRQHWRPDRAFLERRNREQLLVIAQECGCADSYGIGMLRTFKKSELVGCLLRHFGHAHEASDWTPVQQKAKDWLPEAMLFPAINPDVPQEPEPEQSEGDEPLDDAA